MVIDLIYIQINPRIYIFFEICRIFAPTFTNSIFGYFRYSLSLCFPSLVPCLFSFADYVPVVDVIFYHGSATSFVVFILVRRTPLVNGFLGVRGVWGWGRFLLWCVALHSWMLYINTKSLYCFFLQYIPIWVIYFDDFSPSVITEKRPMHHTLYLCKCHPNCSSRPGFVFQCCLECQQDWVLIWNLPLPCEKDELIWTHSTFPCVSWWFCGWM